MYKEVYGLNEFFLQLTFSQKNDRKLISKILKFKGSKYYDII